MGWNGTSMVPLSTEFVHADGKRIIETKAADVMVLLQVNNTVATSFDAKCLLGRGMAARQWDMSRQHDSVPGGR